MRSVCSARLSAARGVRGIVMHDVGRILLVKEQRYVVVISFVAMVKNRSMPKYKVERGKVEVERCVRVVVARRLATAVAAHSERVSQPLRFRRPSPHRADLATSSDPRRVNWRSSAIQRLSRAKTRAATRPTPPPASAVPGHRSPAC